MRFVCLYIAAICTVSCKEPCGIPSIHEGLIIAAEVCEETGDSAESTATVTDSASETTSPTSTTMDETTGGMLPTCVAVPGPGEFWGPCIAGMGDNPPTCTEGFCQSTEEGAICLPSCDAKGCEPFKCLNGTCRVDGACIHPCSKDADCLLPGMVCDTKRDEPMCVYPAP